MIFTSFPTTANPSINPVNRFPVGRPGIEFVRSARDIILIYILYIIYYIYNIYRYKYYYNIFIIIILYIIILWGG